MELLKEAVSKNFQWTLIESQHHQIYVMKNYWQNKMKKAKKPTTLQLDENSSLLEIQQKTFILPLNMSTNIDEAFWSKLAEEKI